MSGSVTTPATARPRRISHLPESGNLRPICLRAKMAVPALAPPLGPQSALQMIEFQPTLLAHCENSSTSSWDNLLTSCAQTASADVRLRKSLRFCVPPPLKVSKAGWSGPSGPATASPGLAPVRRVPVLAERVRRWWQRLEGVRLHHRVDLFGDLDEGRGPTNLASEHGLEGRLVHRELEGDRRRRARDRLWRSRELL